MQRQFGMRRTAEWFPLRAQDIRRFAKTVSAHMGGSEPPKGVTSVLNLKFATLLDHEPSELQIQKAH
jgi:hypothetical protein